MEDMEVLYGHHWKCAWEILCIHFMGNLVPFKGTIESAHLPHFALLKWENVLVDHPILANGTHTIQLTKIVDEIM